ncbi:MAG: response regulator [Terriglobales bacterium]
MNQKADSSDSGPPPFLNVLAVEDSPFDAELLLQELRRAGMNVRMDVAKTAVEVVAFLSGGAYDVVLSDYGLRGWTGLDALRVLRERRPDLPFILVTGSLGDEKAAECIKLGAADFVLKDRLNRLPHAITRALEEKALREQRQAAEEALRRSEANLRSLVENAPYAIYKTNVDSGRFVSANPALVEMLGYESEAEVLPLDLASQVYRDPGTRARLLPELERREHFQDLEIECKRKDGTPLTLRSSGRMVRDGSGERFFEAIAEDVTERRSLERQLRQAQKMEAVGRLAGGVAHDFNNLLTVIRGYAELMLEEEDRDKLRRYAESILKTADRTASLTRQLLAFSRKQVLWTRVLDLNAVVAEIQKMLPPLIGEDVHVIVVPGPKLGRVKADPGQLEQVLLNLAINARDAMPKGGKLVLETANVECDEGYCALHPGAQPGSYVMLAVSDNGCGMDPETQSHIFEPFFTTKPKDKGTGLGLATVYGIVKQSGGHVWVYSEPGIGTTFKVYLPRVEEAVTSERPQPRFEEPAAVTESILLVEDEEGVRRLAREFLEQRGYRVLEARNGAEALAVAASHTGPIDLLVTDIVMPGMRGRELAEKLSSSRPRMKILYISGYTDGTIVENGELGPGSPFLEKPFSSDALARKVREVLNGASAQGEPPAGPEAPEPAEKGNQVRL